MDTLFFSILLFFYTGTVALARFSMNPLLLNQVWTLKGFDENELNTLANYIRSFSIKYPIVGRLVRGDKG